MKKSSIILTLLSMQLCVFAQTSNAWIQDGAEWHHKYLQLQRGYIHYSLEGTVELDGLDFQFVTNEFQEAHIQPEGDYTLGDVTPGSDIYFTTSNDSVFIRKSDGDLQFVWYLNPQVGDVWDFGEQYDEDSETTLNAYALVQSVETVEINGIQTLDIVTTPCLDENGTLPAEDDTYFTNLYAEQINSIFGPKRYFQHIGQYYLYPIPYMILDVSGSSLLCYESENFPFYKVEESNDCYDKIHSLSLDDNTYQSVVIFPNPVKNTLHFSGLLPNQNVVIYSSLGQILHSTQGATSQDIDVRNWTVGLYYFQVINGQNGEVYFGKFVKN